MTPMIIPVFLPNLGCRERCLFCNQRATAKGLPSPSSVRNFIEASLLGLPANKKHREKQIAFYGGSFTAIHKEGQIRYLKEVQPFLDSGLIDSIRVSTRPDALGEEILFLLKEYRVKTVEIGGQSMIDEILFLSKRGHWAKDTVVSTARLKQKGFEVGLHVMMGLPGDTCNRFLQSLDRIIDLKPDFVRIHPTLVLKGAPLETLWRSLEYSPLSLNEAIRWLKRGLLKLENSSIRVVRVGLQPTKELERDFLAGPFHPALHQLVDSAITFDMASHLLQNSSNGCQVLFLCHPKDISNFRGQRNENILKLKETFKLNEILVQNKNHVPRGTLILQGSRGEIAIQRERLNLSTNPSSPNNP
jgi:histone acetyltransferase (RNA polymerase elongator complex component)